MLLATTLAIERASLLFAVLTLVADAIVVVAVALALGARLSAGGRGRAEWVRGSVSRMGLWPAAAVAVTATAGSLWFSEVAGLPPCRFCWFQRCAMYPLALVLTVAAARRDRAVAWYAVPLAVAGLGLSTYHYLLEWYPSLDQGGCEISAPCTLVYFRRFGFASLPFMAGSGFLAIIVLVLAARRPAPGGRGGPAGVQA